MIKCSKCKQLMPKANYKVIETRSVTYQNVLFIKKNRKNKTNSKKIIHYQPLPEEIEKCKLEGWNLIKSWKTSGKEIVKEINICNECEKDYEQNKECICGHGHKNEDGSITITHFSIKNE